MPEIWIPYGDVEISVDIDSNNLSGIFKNEKTEFDDTILENNQILNNLNEKVTIFDICNSIGSISVIEMLIEIIKNSKRTNQIEIIIRKNHKKNIENLLKDKEFQHNIKVIEKLSIDEIKEIINDNQVILLSNASFDSLFGFNGGAISLARILKDPIIKDAFYDKEIIYPESGIITNRSKIVQKKYEGYSNIISVQIIEDADGISNCVVGKLYDSYVNSSKVLTNNIRHIENKFESCIISCDYNKKNTLNDSLNGIWNLYNSIEKKGNITLVSESLDGFGSDGLDKYAMNQINIKNLISNNEYFEGLENLIFLEKINQEYSIDIISTIPHHYIEKRFKFRPFNTVNSALNSTIRRKGKRVEIAIIPHANNMIMKVGSGKTV